MRGGSGAQPDARGGGAEWVGGVPRIAERAGVGRLADRRRVTSRRARVRGLGQLGDVVEVDVVFGACSGSHYEL